MDLRRIILPTSFRTSHKAELPLRRYRVCQPREAEVAASDLFGPDSNQRLSEDMLTMSQTELLHLTNLNYFPTYYTDNGIHEFFKIIVVSPFHLES